MQYASFELSEQLYKITGWKTGRLIDSFGSSYSSATTPRNGKTVEYDLNFLLTKTPQRSDDIRDTVLLGRSTDNSKWTIVYQEEAYSAEKPEDAVAKLLIALAAKK